MEYDINKPALLIVGVAFAANAIILTDEMRNAFVFGTPPDNAGVELIAVSSSTSNVEVIAISPSKKESSREPIFYYVASPKKSGWKP